MPQVVLHFFSPTSSVISFSDPAVGNERGPSEMSVRGTTARVPYKVEETLGCLFIWSLYEVSKGHSPTVVLAPVFVHSEIQTGMQWKYNVYLYVGIQ